MYHFVCPRANGAGIPTTRYLGTSPRLFLPTQSPTFPRQAYLRCLCCSVLRAKQGIKKGSFLSHAHYLGSLPFFLSHQPRVPFLCRHHMHHCLTTAHLGPREHHRLSPLYIPPSITTPHSLCHLHPSPGPPPFAQPLLGPNSPFPPPSNLPLKPHFTTTTTLTAPGPDLCRSLHIPAHNPLLLFILHHLYER